MRLPQDEKKRARLQEFLRHQRENVGFSVFKDWLTDELHARDAENRVRGLENTTTEAQALSQILDIIAACQAPVVDRSNDGSGAEGRSAAICM